MGCAVAAKRIQKIYGGEDTDGKNLCESCFGSQASIEMSGECGVDQVARSDLSLPMWYHTSFPNKFLRPPRGKDAM